MNTHGNKAFESNTYTDIENTKHTPGPWGIMGDDYAQGSHIAIHGEGHNITSVSKASRNWKANARLIAASPDLLAAAMNMRRWAESYRTLVGHGAAIDADIEALDAAIAKATHP